MKTQPAKRCPLCGLRERAAVSDESRARDVAEDTWTLTPLGAAVLARSDRHESEIERIARIEGRTAAEVEDEIEANYDRYAR